MKKMFTLAMMMVMTITANAMSYAAAKNEALFLSDKMAYELNLSDAQYEAVYEINLDYMMSVNGRNDILGPWWNRRNADLQYVLTVYQYNKYVGLYYFYQPLSWNAGHWTFNVYRHYANHNHLYKTHPKVYLSYKGGNNHKPATHYAGWKPTQTTRGNNSAWKNTDNHHGNGMNNHHIAKSNNQEHHFRGRK